MTRLGTEVGATANQYEVLAKLAEGGMAEIFLARGASAAGVERYVVLKRILREREHDPALVQMFLEEARLAAQLNHPNVAQVYDVGQLGDSYFFTMEYVHGETVRALLKRARGLGRPLPLVTILTIAAGAAAGLHHAHDRRGLDGRPLAIVHRDVSPSNLMVSYEGGVKVVDFGVAKAQNRATETRSGAVKGKISYLSPEQCRTATLDRRSDLFSVGIVLWELLAGERLYRRGTDFETMSAIVDEPPPPPSRWRADIPPALDAIVLRLLAKDPGARFQTADELIEAFEALAAQAQVALSSSALARFMRELFGQRPEPWLALAAARGGGDVAGPHGAAPPLAAMTTLELQLAAAPVLDAYHHGSASASASASASDADPPSQSASTSGVMGGFAASSRPSAPALPAFASAPPLGPPPAASQGDVGGASVGQPSTSSSGASDYASRSGVARPSPQAPAVAGGGGRVYLAIVGGAALVGVGLAVAISGAGGGRGARPASAVADLASVAPGDAAPAEAIDAPSGAAGVDAGIDAGVDAGIDAGVDAGVDAGIDASGAAASPPDAATPSARLDAAGGDAPALDPRAQIEAAVGAGRWADALGACRALTAPPAACVRAACGAHEASRARAWLGKLPAVERASVVEACKTRGIDLTPRPPRSDCAADPLSCQF